MLVVRIHTGSPLPRMFQSGVPRRLTTGYTVLYSPLYSFGHGAAVISVLRRTVPSIPLVTSLPVHVPELVLVRLATGVSRMYRFAVSPG